MAKKPNYSPKELKAALNFMSGIDFEIHESYALVKARVKRDATELIFHVDKLPETTEELIWSVKSCFAGCRLENINRMTLKAPNGTRYTREGNEENMLWEHIQKKGAFYLDEPEDDFLEKAVEHQRFTAYGRAVELVKELRPIEWGAPEPGERLDEKVVSKVNQVLGRFD